MDRQRSASPIATETGDRAANHVVLQVHKSRSLPKDLQWSRGANRQSKYDARLYGRWAAQRLDAPKSGPRLPANRAF